MTLQRAVLMIVGLTLATVAEARLGETMPELIARFGESVRPGKTTVFVDGNPRKVGDYFMFFLEDWRIDVVMIDGVCARIRYTKSGALTDEQIAGVLKINSQDFGWKEESPASGRKWIRADGAVATWDKALGIALELPSYAERTRDRKVAPARGTSRRSSTESRSSP